jgi:hypothetical protein
MDAITPATSADLRQVAGGHYKVADLGAQHWNMLLSAGFGPEYYVGQATKYLSRWQKKNGLRDLAKGKHFIEKLLEIVEQRGADFLRFGNVQDDTILEQIANDHMITYLNHFFAVNEVDAASCLIISLVMFANNAEVLRHAITECDRLENSELARDASKTTEDLEPPVALQFSFHGYTENDCISWRCKACGEKLVLGIDKPPNLAHATCVGKPYPGRSL